MRFERNIRRTALRDSMATEGNNLGLENKYIYRRENKCIQKPGGLKFIIDIPYLFKVATWSDASVTGISTLLSIFYLCTLKQKSKRKGVLFSCWWQGSFSRSKNVFRNLVAWWSWLCFCFTEIFTKPEAKALSTIDEHCSVFFFLRRWCNYIAIDYWELV